jgi:hypothetical protein
MWFNNVVSSVSCVMSKAVTDHKLPVQINSHMLRGAIIRVNSTSLVPKHYQHITLAAVVSVYSVCKWVSVWN